MVCVVFFKQKTAYEMRISDWSSDMCSLPFYTYNTDLGPHGDTRHDARAKAEHQTDGEEVKDRLVGGDDGDIEQGDQNREGIVADRIAPFPAYEPAEILFPWLAPVSPQRCEAQNGGQSSTYCEDDEEEDRKSTRLNSSH